MHWLQVGCCGLALVNLSVALIPTVQVKQNPRFYGVRTRRSVMIYCEARGSTQPAQVEWYKTTKYDEKPTNQVAVGEKISIKKNNQTRKFVISLKDLRIEDSGVYFCKVHQSWGPGTEIQVFRPYNSDSAVYRSKMKDALILIQAFLLTLCAIAPFICYQTRNKKEETVYEEPKYDHIYEGLAIEHCGGDLYEDISMYAQPETADAAWEQD